ncbi:hypothetical protein L0F63_001603 [Massospora cicadina]|nr:hypothetical protein L0F63_001603 [Massospora cicadina]
MDAMYSTDFGECKRKRSTDAELIMEPNQDGNINYSSNITSEDRDTIRYWSSIMNGISLVGAIAVVVVVLVSNYLGSVASRRLSFRMSMWIALSDVLFCCFSFFDVDDDPMLCPPFTAMTYFCNLLYVFLTTSMTINLHLTLLCANSRWGFNARKAILNEGVLLATSAAVALAIALPPCIIAIVNGECVLFHVVDNKGAKVLMLWLTVGVWECLCFVYTTVVVAFVVNTLKFHSRLLSTHGPGANSHCGTAPVVEEDPDGFVRCRSRPASSQTAKEHNRHSRGDSTASNSELGSHVDRVARRVLFYPLIPLVTQSFYIGINSYFLYIGHRTLTLLYLFYLIPYSAGLLNALVFFMFDPAMPEISCEIKASFICAPLPLKGKLRPPIVPERQRPSPVTVRPQLTSCPTINLQLEQSWDFTTPSHSSLDNALLETRPNSQSPH